MKKALTALILAFAMILTLTACKAAMIPENPDNDPSNSGVSDPGDFNAESDNNASVPDSPDAASYPAETRYYLLPDDTLYAVIEDSKASNEDEWDPYSGMLFIGYTFVRENNAETDSLKKFGLFDEWNGLTVESAESGWECWSGLTYPDIPKAISHHQNVRFTGKITFTGKAKISYSAGGQNPEYITFVLDEECSSKMPVFISSSDKDEFGYRRNVFFLITDESMHRDEIEKLLLDGKEVYITVTTDDFTWRQTDYGLSIDGSTHGLFNNIIDFKYTVI